MSPPKKTWMTVSLGTLAGFRNGINYNQSNFGRGIRVVNVKDFKDRSIAKLDGLDEINPEGIVRYESLLRDDDILFVRSNGNRELIGRSMIIRGVKGDVIHSAFSIKVRFHSKKALPRFYAYLFRSDLIRQTLSLHGGGTNISNLNQDILNNLEVPLPPFELQRKVVSILSAYDDLIENNTRRIDTLESLAQALYQEWFVRFRFPGHENVKLVNSPLGKIPEGWRNKPLREIADLRLGKMLDAKKNKGDLMPYLANVNVRWGEFDFQNLRQMRFEADELESYGLKYGDIVMCEGGEPGRCAVWTGQMPNMMIQKAIHRIRCGEEVNFRYLYWNLRDKGQTGRLESLFTGATIKHLPREKLSIVSVEVPPKSLMDLFSKMVEPITCQIDVITKQNANLRKTRDLLLPKLISGQIDVEHLDIEVGADLVAATP